MNYFEVTQCSHASSRATKRTNLVEILASGFTITAEVDVRKETPIKMSVCFSTVLFY